MTKEEFIGRAKELGRSDDYIHAELRKYEKAVKENIPHVLGVFLEAEEDLKKITRFP